MWTYIMPHSSRMQSRLKSDILVGFHLVPNLQIAIWQLAFTHSTIDIPGYDDSPRHGQPRRRRLGFRR